jgi:membrane protein
MAGAVWGSCVSLACLIAWASRRMPGGALSRGSILSDWLWIAVRFSQPWPRSIATIEYTGPSVLVWVMVWLWISAGIILLGGKVNAEMEHQTARDDIGESKLLGQGRRRGPCR